MINLTQRAKERKMIEFCSIFFFIITVLKLIVNPFDAGLILMSLFVECMRHPGGVEKITIFSHFYVYLVVFKFLVIFVCGKLATTVPSGMKTIIGALMFRGQWW